MILSISFRIHILPSFDLFSSMRLLHSCERRYHNNARIPYPWVIFHCHFSFAFPSGFLWNWFLDWYWKNCRKSYPHEQCWYYHKILKASQKECVASQLHIPFICSFMPNEPQNNCPHNSYCYDRSEVRHIILDTQNINDKTYNNCNNKSQYFHLTSHPFCCFLANKQIPNNQSN